MNKNQVVLSLVILSLIGMSSAYLDVFEMITKDPIAEEKTTVKHGEVRQFTKDRKLKTVVNYDQGIKHGTSYLYHNDGETVLLAMPYKNGKREGVSQKYYENGALYASTSYHEDKLHGQRKIYYSTGQLKAEINYGYGHHGIGTKEYLMDGEEKSEIKIITKKNGSIIWLETSEPCSDITFYIGKLIEDTYFDPVDQNVGLLTKENGRYFVDTNIYTPSYLKYQDIVCACESSQGNPIILKTRIH